MKIVALGSLALRFCLELAAYAALASWGASGSGPLAVRTALAVGPPVLALAAWSRLAPKAPRRPAPAVAVTMELTVFTSAAVALAAAGAVPLAIAFGLLAAADVALVRLPSAADAMAVMSRQVRA